MYVPYLFVLKTGSNTHRGSNVRLAVQQNERNNATIKTALSLGPFKHQVPKLLNVINLKMVPNISLFSIFS